MAMRVLPLFVTLLVGALPFATVSFAEQPVRSGPSVGFGLGGAYVSWTWPDDERRTEGSGAGNARIAWAFDQDLLVGVEGWAWSKDYAIGSTPEDIPAQTTVWAIAIAATYFPGNTGFFLRGGVGVGGGKADVTPPPSVDFPVSGTWTATGMSILGAMGYEVGLTPHMSLGGEIDAVYVGIDTTPFSNVFGYGLTAQLNWYW